MGFSKTLIALSAMTSVIATPALASAERLSVAAQPAAKASKDVRANTGLRKSSKLGGITLVIIGGALAAGLGIAAVAGAFDGDDEPDSN